MPNAKSVLIDAQEYNRYMAFISSEKEPWDEDYISRQLANVGAVNSIISDQDVESIKFCYRTEPNFRHYHEEKHGGFVGQEDAPDALMSLVSERFKPKAKSVLAIAGLFHDVAYKHVDEINDQGRLAWRTTLRKEIDKVAKYKRTVEGEKVVFRTTLTKDGKNDPITQMVAHIFGMDRDGSIIHNQGGNEFDSALAAAKFLTARGVSPKSIVAVVAAIEATIPFKTAVTRNENGRIVSDGRMGELAHRVKSLEFKVGDNVFKPDWEDTNDIVLLSTHLCNRDASSFYQPDNFATIVREGRNIKYEERPELRKEVTNIKQLASAAGVERSSPILYRWLGSGEGPVAPADVPHLYILRDNQGSLQQHQQGDEVYAYPPVKVYEAAVEHVKRNTYLASKFFEAHEVGILLAASMATLMGESEASVPGIVDSREWNKKAIPHRRPTQQWSRDEERLYEELMFGMNQKDVNTAITRRSPIGGLIFGVLGVEGVERLSNRIQKVRDAAQAEGNTDPFSNPERPDIAQAYIKEVRDAIGEDNFRTIVTELHRVARLYQDSGGRERLEKLERLFGKPLVYTTKPLERSR